MSKALLIFSNGEKLVLPEGQRVITIIKSTYKDEILTSVSEVYTLWDHASAGMIPSVTELLCRCNFFHLIENEDKVYNSSSVVTIENI